MLTKKILTNDFKISTLKIKCVKSKFTNFNSFEKALKMPKIT
jgi:hypothetical protein